MELSEVIEEIILKKFSNVPETQRPRELAQLLHIGEMDARRLMAAGRNQRKQFQIVLKIIAVCKNLNIDPARPLQSLTDERCTGETDNVDRDVSKEAIGIVKKAIAKKPGTIENPTHDPIPAGKFKKRAPK